MNKAAFSDELRRHLKSLPNAERNQHIEYYEEMIEDRMEDGLSEEEAVAALGTVSNIAIQILGDSPQKSPRKFRIWEIVLIVLGSPLWLSLLICIAAAVLCIVLSIVTVYLILWVCIATLYCGVLALVAGCAAAILGSISYLINAITAPGILFLGGALVCIGCAVLLFFLCNRLSVLLWKVGKWTATKTIGIFRRKDGKK